MTLDRRAARAGLAVLLFAAALAPRLYHVRSPYMDFADHNTSNFSIFARNYLEHGWIATRLGQVRNAGPASSGELIVFAHHPPTIALLTSIAFRIAGATEPAARALPLILSAATCPLIWFVGRRLLGGWALAAAILFAAAPGAIYYGQMLDHEAFVVFAGLACLLAWIRWAETRSGAWWGACLSMMSATILIDWPGVYLAPALVLATRIDRSTRPEWRGRAISIAIAAGASLALVLAHILLLKGSYTDLLTSLQERTLSPRAPFSWGEYLYRILGNLEYALTPPLLMAAAAGAVASAVAVAISLRRRAAGHGASPRAGAVAAALAVFGGSHHAIFTNACHFNEHLIYYLLPGLVLLAAALPAAAARTLESLRAPRPFALAAGLAACAVAGAPLLARAGPQTWSYFNDVSAPGWPLLGMALNDAVPRDGVLISTETLANPQFLFYQWRRQRAPVRDPLWLATRDRRVRVLHDLNMEASPEVEDVLALLPSAPVLNFTLHAARGVEPGSDSVRALAADPGAWEPTTVSFDGGAADLTMFRAGPRALGIEPVSALDRWLGVRWTPAAAGGRIVHASFAWERLAGEAATLEPAYALVHEGRGVTAPRMWPPPSGVAGLAPFPEGSVVRHEVDWFLGEWMPAGTYTLRVSLIEKGRPLRVTSGAGRTYAEVATITAAPP